MTQQVSAAEQEMIERLQARARVGGAYKAPLPPPARFPINVYRIGAGIAQAASLLTTYAFFLAVMASADLVLIIAVSACVEFVLFLGKKMLFSARQHQNSRQIAVPSIVLDTLLNAGGIWPYAKNLAMSPPAIMLAEALALRGTIGAVPALILSLVAGYLLAVAPHTLWKAGD